MLTASRGVWPIGYRRCVRLPKALTAGWDAVRSAVRDATPWAWPPPVIVLCAWCGAMAGEGVRLIALVAVVLVVGLVLAALGLKRRK